MQDVQSSAKGRLHNHLAYPYEVTRIKIFTVSRNPGENCNVRVVPLLTKASIPLTCKKLLVYHETRPFENICALGDPFNVDDFDVTSIPGVGSVKFATRWSQRAHFHNLSVRLADVRTTVVVPASQDRPRWLQSPGVAKCQTSTLDNPLAQSLGWPSHFARTAPCLTWERTPELRQILPEVTSAPLGVASAMFVSELQQVICNFGWATCWHDF